MSNFFLIDSGSIVTHGHNGLQVVESHPVETISDSCKNRLGPAAKAPNAPDGTVDTNNEKEKGAMLYELEKQSFSLRYQ